VVQADDLFARARPVGLGTATAFLAGVHATELPPKFSHRQVDYGQNFGQFGVFRRVADGYDECREVHATFFAR
jgi:hypothetical protein